MGHIRIGRRQLSGWLALLFAILTSTTAWGDLGAHDYSVEITATVSDSPPRINLSWILDTNAVQYFISRKYFSENHWRDMAVVPGEITTWSDDDVQNGVVYEYQIKKTTTGSYLGYGYIAASIDRPVIENRGRLILLVEDSLAAALPFELVRLQQDLVGDGWIVLRHDVSAGASVTNVKSVIQADYSEDPTNTKSLFLFGHVPVPHSGDIAPDTHADHRGAWPADVFYGEFTGLWTDSTVTRTNSYTSLPNIPGDGKFDQSEPPGPVVLQIGRVDLSGMTCFANKTPSRSEVDLARNYLNKDHLFRNAFLDVKRRALVYDNGIRGLEPEPQACAAWRSFPGFFGNNGIQPIGPQQFLPATSSQSYLWAYIRSTGSYSSVDWVATSDDWAVNAPKVVFTSFLGSYFGEWDKESDVLRAPLAANGYALTSIFSGQPQWILHPMSLGEPIGYCALLTQNNRTNGTYPPHLNPGVGQVHIALMGDPTLRLHPVSPPSAVSATTLTNGLSLRWSRSADAAVTGYFVYKARTPFGPFERISGDAPVSQLSFVDDAPADGEFYMIRALKLEQTPSGAYFNLSQGAFFPDIVLGDGGPPATPEDLNAINIRRGGVSLRWLERSYGVRAFDIQRRLFPNGEFRSIAQASGLDANFEDATAPTAVVAYRIRALGVNGASDFTGEVVVNLQPSAVLDVNLDTATQGAWIGKYGADGFVIPFAATNPPSYLAIVSNNAAPILLATNSNSRIDTLFRPGGDSRLASELRSDWRTSFSYVRGTLELKVRCADSLVRQLSIYMEDPSGTRAGRIEVYDPYTERILQSVPYSNYVTGQYINLLLRNFADVRIIPTDSSAATAVSGLFFSTPSLNPPVLTPPSGSFVGSVNVTMTSLDPGSAVRYTLDGSDPTANSTAYSQPLTLTSNALISARVFKEGWTPSEITRVALTNTLETEVRLLSVDSQTSGDWKSSFGSSGALFVGGPDATPSWAQINLQNLSPWKWDANSTDSRALNLYDSNSVRIASCWFADGDIHLDVKLWTNSLQQFAVYLLDWDKSGRIEDISIVSDSGTTLLQTRAENFEVGRYFVFAAKGDFTLNAHAVAGPNAVISGLFFGGAVATPVRLTASPAIHDDAISFQVDAALGQTIELQSSPDCLTWTTRARQILSTIPSTISIPWSDAEGPCLFRALVL